MLLSSNESNVDIGAAPGTVVITVALSAPGAEIWQALTKPALVARWFGTLTPALCPGEKARLDFGDGDFFDLAVIQLESLRLVQYAWRFLGIGPLDTITWCIVPQDTGCLVTVTDSEPERTAEAAQELSMGWLDFTERLARFLTTDQVTRYDWRREFDGSIELPGALEIVRQMLFASEMQAQWLPLGGSVLEAGAYFTLANGNEPSLFQVTDVVWDAPTQVQFGLTQPGWLGSTICLLKLTPRCDRTLLTVSHKGWEVTGWACEDQRQLRKRFSAFWINVLQYADQLIRSSKPVK
jgi:uncharacterized protein YndB with AHSA1/START domain